MRPSANSVLGLKLLVHEAVAAARNERTHKLQLLRHSASYMTHVRTLYEFTSGGKATDKTKKGHEFRRVLLLFRLNDKHLLLNYT
jgi:hypothetical protein